MTTRHRMLVQNVRDLNVVVRVDGDERFTSTVGWSIWDTLVVMLVTVGGTVGSYVILTLLAGWSK